LNSSLAKNNTVQAQTNGKDSISFKTTLESPPYPTTHLRISQKSNITFGSGSPLCPTNDCKQEFIGAFYDIGSISSVQGTLKIENKTTSTLDIIKYSMIPFYGNFHVTGIEENRKTGHSIMVFTGDIGLAGGTSIMDTISKPRLLLIIRRKGDLILGMF
jgi:hypothetical protein